RPHDLGDGGRGRRRRHLGLGGPAKDPGPDRRDVHGRRRGLLRPLRKAPPVKIALAQINARVGDIPGNLAKIRDFAHRAEGLGAQLCVFPEQSLGGYPALDMWEEPAFVRANLEALRTLARSAGSMGLLVGFVDSSKAAVGKPIHNAAALLHRGRVAAIRHKSLLPTYDVFDEARYF